MEERYIGYYGNAGVNLKIVVTDRGVVGIEFLEKKVNEKKEPNNKILKDVKKQLDEYFAGKRKKFDVKYILEGTEFHMSVWKAIARIPFGKHKAYSEIAEFIGKPKAVRAVGGACGKNPVPVIIPCHRVLGKDGSLTGFGGGIKVKKILLNLEGIEK